MRCDYCNERINQGDEVIELELQGFYEVYHKECTEDSFLNECRKQGTLNKIGIYDGEYTR